MSSIDYSTLIEQLQHISNNPPEDAETRRNVATALRKAFAALETPLDLVHRIAYSPLQLIISKVACDMNLFDVIGKVEEGYIISLSEVVEKTGAQQDLIVRILRFLAANGLVDQVTSATYAPTKGTKALSQPGFRAAIEHHFEAQLPAWSSLPSFLASTAYHVPTSVENTAFQLGHSTPLPAFQYAAANPKMMSNFAQWMAAQRQGEETWLKVMTHSDLLKPSPANEASNDVLLVDVGGGVGHQSKSFKDWLPSGSNHRIVLQDLPPVVARAAKMEGVEIMPHDFWQEQPVKGAKFYYLRNVFHDYADEACKVILRRIKDAASPASTILIDERVLSDKVESFSNDAEVNASLDLLLMASLAGLERTEAQWRSLLESEGLEIHEIRNYSYKGHSVIIASIEK